MGKGRKRVPGRPLTGGGLGRHALIDFYGCHRGLINDEGALREMLLKAASASGAGVVLDVSHRFSPLGVSVLIVIKESHMALHTWPEHGFAALDVFSCSESIKVEVVKKMLREALNAKGMRSRTILRGRKR